jgi:hypothetical protein
MGDKNKRIPEGYHEVGYKEGETHTARKKFSYDVTRVASDNPTETDRPNYAMLLDLAKKSRGMAQRRPDWFGLTHEQLADSNEALNERIARVVQEEKQAEEERQEQEAKERLKLFRRL